MICSKLYEFIATLDKRTLIEFVANSMEKIVHFEGTVFEFLKSDFYRIYSMDFICDIKIKGNVFTNGVLFIAVNTATE